MSLFVFWIYGACNGKMDRNYVFGENDSLGVINTYKQYIFVYIFVFMDDDDIIINFHARFHLFALNFISHLSF